MAQIAKHVWLALALGVPLSCMITAWAAEGTTVAGPIGGTDIRSAFLPRARQTSRPLDRLRSIAGDGSQRPLTWAHDVPMHVEVFARYG